MDLGKPRTDVISPDFPPDSEYDRPVDNASCLVLPQEGPHVIGVSALGPSQNKSDFSTYGLEQISVVRAGGLVPRRFRHANVPHVRNMILSSYPKHVLQEEGSVDDDGNIVAGRRNLRIQGLPAEPAPAATTPTCRGPRWRRHTPLESPHSS